MKTFKRYAVFSAVALLWIMVGGTLRADDRKEPIDVIIALDKSLSMEEEVAAVREYVNTSIVDQLLIPGDYFLLVAFYGKTEVLVSRTVETEADKQAIREAVSAIRADGRYTDIGNALDVLGKKVEESPNSERRKHLLLITDGRQEAPPDSRYWSPDGTFNHEFLANTRIIQKMGWKIHVLGLGTHHEARQLAQELSGTYTTIEESGSARQLSGEIAAQTRGFLGRVDLSAPPHLSPVAPDGSATLELDLESRDYPEAVSLTVDRLRLSLPGREWDDILAGGPVALDLPAAGPASVRIAVRLPDPPKRGAYTGSLEFLFAPGESFIPSVTEVEFQVQSVIERNLKWVLPGLAVLLALLALLVVLLVRRSRNPRIRFKITIEGQPAPAGRDIFSLKEGRGLFINEASDNITMSESRSAKSVARVFVANRLLRMNVLRRERFPKLKDVPADIRGEAFRIRSDSGKDLSVRFVRLEQDG